VGKKGKRRSDLPRAALSPEPEPPARRALLMREEWGEEREEGKAWRYLRAWLYPHGGEEKKGKKRRKIL